MATAAAASAPAQEHSAETPRATLFKHASALFALLAVTVGANFLDLGAFNIAVAMLIALVKGALIVLIFMEVRHRSPLLWMFVGAGFFWLMLLLTLMMGDYVSRPVLQPNWVHRTGPTNHVEFPAGDVDK
jgi:caa(3)-type oxidase subunit IV